ACVRFAISPSEISGRLAATASTESARSSCCLSSLTGGLQELEWVRNFHSRRGSCIDSLTACKSSYRRALLCTPVVRDAMAIHHRSIPGACQARRDRQAGRSPAVRRLLRGLEWTLRQVSIDACPAPTRLPEAPSQERLRGLADRGPQRCRAH